MKTIGLMFGGQSPEHEISILSAKSIYKYIDKEKYNVTLIAVDKQGKMVSGDGCFDYLENAIENNIKPLKYDELKYFDVIFPAFHGPFGEDGTIQGLLQFMGIPYVGCNIESSAINMHKGLMRDLFSKHNIDQPDYIYFKEINVEEAITFVENNFSFPIFIKPCKGGSSLGISKIEKGENIKQAVEKGFKFDNEVIIEEGFPSTSEIEIAILGENTNHIVSPPGKLVPGDSFYTYEDKYKNNKTKFEIPCHSISSEIATEIRTTASFAFTITKCSGLARIDFLYNSENNNFVINEINTMPGFTEISMYPKLIQATGLSFTDLITKLITIAENR